MGTTGGLFIEAVDELQMLAKISGLVWLVIGGKAMVNQKATYGLGWVFFAIERAISHEQLQRHPRQHNLEFDEANFRISILGAWFELLVLNGLSGLLKVIGLVELVFLDGDGREYPEAQILDVLKRVLCGVDGGIIKKVDESIDRKSEIHEPNLLPLKHVLVAIVVFRLILGEDGLEIVVEIYKHADGVFLKQPFVGVVENHDPDFITLFVVLEDVLENQI